jgi:hypothetical protein
LFYSKVFIIAALMVVVSGQSYKPSSYPVAPYKPEYPAPGYRPSYPAPAYKPSYPEYKPEYKPSYSPPAYPAYPAQQNYDYVRFSLAQVNFQAVFSFVFN